MIETSVVNLCIIVTLLLYAYILLLDNLEWLLRILEEDTVGSGDITIRLRLSSDGVKARGVLL